MLVYILNIYPQGIKINQMLEPLIKCFMEGTSLYTSWSVAEVLAAINGYKQQDEKECHHFKDKWQLVEPPKGFVRIISV
jgi:hypothetical protein